MTNVTRISPRKSDFLAEPTPGRRESAALAAHEHALRRGMTWRHALRDALAAADAAAAGQSWRCPVCQAFYAIEADAGADRPARKSRTSGRNKTNTSA